MRVNIYAEEMTDRVSIISKTTPDGDFTGLRFWLHLPVTVPPESGNGLPTQVQGPFMHHPGDDDSAAVTFWGKRDLRKLLMQALVKLDEHYGDGGEANNFAQFAPGAPAPTAHLTFGQALAHMRIGKSVTRDGWNGAGQSVRIKAPAPDADPYAAKAQPFLQLSTSSGERVPWTASQSDVLASDWRVVMDAAIAGAAGARTGLAGNARALGDESVAG